MMDDSHLRNAFGMIAKRLGTPNEKKADAKFFAILQVERNRRDL